MSVFQPSKSQRDKNDVSVFQPLKSQRDKNYVSVFQPLKSLRGKNYSDVIRYRTNVYLTELETQGLIADVLKNSFTRNSKTFPVKQDAAFRGVFRTLANI